MSLAKKGKPLSDEHKKNLSIARQLSKFPRAGIKWSDIAKNKRKAKYETEAHPRAYRVEVEINGVIQNFKSANAAAKHFGCNIYTILNDKLTDCHVTIHKNA
jgi:hypothetical protein